MKRMRISSMSWMERTSEAITLLRKRVLRMDLLIWWTLVGVVVGVILGASLGRKDSTEAVTRVIGYPGLLLIRALQELMLPLIVASIMNFVFTFRYNKTGGTGWIIRRSVVYYSLTMLLAIGLGLMMAFTIKPGQHAPLKQDATCQKEVYLDILRPVSIFPFMNISTSSLDSLLRMGLQVVPSNIFEAAVESNYIGVVGFSVVLSLVLKSFGDKAQPVVRLVDLGHQAILKLMYIVISLSPIGVASLVASSILRTCNLPLLIRALGLYVATVICGIVIHTFVILPLALLVLAHRNPIRAFRAMLPAFSMGAGTSSSGTTMPITMKCVTDYGCSTSIVRFLIPFGSGINRDGTALYEAVAIIFICQAHGLSFTAGDIFTIIFTTLLATFATASLPSSALVSFITVFQVLGLQQVLTDVAILYAADWLLGMLRTIVNIWSEICACIIIDTWSANEDRLPTLDLELARIPSCDDKSSEKLITVADDYSIEQSKPLSGKLEKTNVPINPIERIIPGSCRLPDNSPYVEYLLKADQPRALNVSLSRSFVL